MEREKIEQVKNSNPLNQDEIQIYLKDIRKLKVMTPEREKILSERMVSNDCTDREKELIYKELLEGNLRFVITVAKQYQNQGIDLSDLIAEGNFGLMKAIKNFDWTKNNRFISYAVWWIKQSILQSLNENSRTIRLPVNVVEKMLSIMSVLDDRERTIVEDYYGLSGTPRTLEDIGIDFGLTKERVRQIKEKALRRLRNESSELFDYL